MTMLLFPLMFIGMIVVIIIVIAIIMIYNYCCCAPHHAAVIIPNTETVNIIQDSYEQV
jgi:uncharacterized membrane protein YukC